jgi:hypothetical protein
MICNNSIGNLGRIGNQMFQYASLVGVAVRHGYEYCLPPLNVVGTLDSNCARSDSHIFNTFNIPEVVRKILDVPVIEEACFELDTNIFDNCPDNVALYGYFQTEKYFEHVEDEIRTAFTFQDKIYSPCHEQFKSEFGETDVIAIHVRRGDYLNYTHHPIQPVSYYEKGLSYFNKDLPVLIFSDDIGWCKSQELFSGERFLFSENNTTAVDLCVQSLCKYHIIANSSFSWWGAWLAKSKKVIAPKNWFGPPLTHNTKQLYLEDWILC